MSRNEIHTVTDVLDTGCRYTLRVRIYVTLRVATGILANSIIDHDFTIIGERVGEFARAPGKCCANSKVNSKIELPTSAISRGGGEGTPHAGSGECECVSNVYT